jgi:hypothetical protein
MDAFQIFALIGVLIAMTAFLLIILNSINTDIDDEADLENGNKPKKSITSKT